MTDFLSRPRYSFESGDTIRLDGRCGLVVVAISPGVLVLWWDDSREWVEMSKLENLSSGQPAMEIAADNPSPVYGSNVTMNSPVGPLSAAEAQGRADLQGVLHGG